MLGPESLGIGVFMYTPAILKGVSKKLASWTALDSICFDFEDGLAEQDLEEAENGIVSLLEDVYKSNSRKVKVFIRVRDAFQFKRIAPIIPPECVNGFVFPKVTSSNFLRFFETYARYMGSRSGFIPILETEEIADTRTRYAELTNLYQQFKEVEGSLTCLQLGAADLCRIYGLRRPLGFTIYDVQILASLIADILSVYLRDFAITGAVFEYFEGEFEEALRRECLLDKLNGFTSKLAIHPNQLPVIKDAFQVQREEIAEARQLIETNLSVVKSSSGRMNERSTHLEWAKKIVALQNAQGKEC